VGPNEGHERSVEPTHRRPAEETRMKVTRSYWDKYATQRAAQRSRANLLRLRGIGKSTLKSPRRPR